MTLTEPNSSNEVYYNIYMGNCDNGEVRHIFMPIKATGSSMYTYAINRICVWDTFSSKWVEIYAPTVAESTTTVSGFVTNGITGGYATYRIFDITKKLHNIGPLANGAQLFNVSIVRTA